MTDLAARYAKAAALWPTKLTPLISNAAPLVSWLDDTHVIYRSQVGAVVVDVVSGGRRTATADEASSLPEPWPMGSTIGEGEPPSALVMSPDRRWGLGQVAGNLILVSDNVSTPLTTDGSPLDGYGIYSGNWRAGFIPRSRHDGDLPPCEAHWAPDSSRVIVPRIDMTRVDPYPLLETAPLDGTFRPKVHLPRFPLTGEETPAISWHAFEVASGARVPLALPEGLLVLHQDLTALRKISFSSDCTHAYVVAHGADMRSGLLLDVDLRSGASTVVISETRHPRMDLSTSSYRPPNVFVLGDLERVVWFSQRDGWGHLYLYSGSGELLNQITSGDWTVRDVVCCADEWLYFTGSGRDQASPYLRSLYRVRYDGSSLTLLSPGEGDCEVDPTEGLLLGQPGAGDFLSPAGDLVVVRSSTVGTPPITVVRSSLDGSLLSVLETADAAAVENLGYRPPTEFVAKAADGSTDIHGLIYLPADFDPSLKYPILVRQYASPLTAATPRTYIGAISGAPGIGGPGAFAALGLVCLTLDARGTTGRSTAFADHGYGALNLIGLDDYVAAIEQLAADHQWVDASRIAIMGVSYGGFAVLRAMLEYPTVFTVGLCDAPMAVPHLMYPDYHWEAYHGRPSYDGSARRTHSTAVPDNFDAVNALAQVDRLQGHLLITVGELDENCPLGNVMPFVAAAIERDKDVELLFVPGSSHYTIHRTRYVARRHLDYLVQHLLGLTPPDSPDLSTLEQLPEPAIRKVPSPW
ncbi:MAG: S9 family peptidase [Candidatus Dormibacteria bacterium]